MTATTLAAALLKDVPRYGTDPDDCSGFILVHTPDGPWLDRADVLSALTAALDPAIADRAGEVVKELRLPWTIAENMQPLLPQAADLITALLAQIAALRAERDALAERNKENSRLAEENAQGLRAAEAQIAALTARVEGLTGALRAIADSNIQSFMLDANFGGYKLSDNRRYCDAPDVQRLMATARAALSTTEASHE